MLLDTDSRPSADPGPQVMEFAQWAYRTRRGIFAFACDRQSPNRPAIPADLDAFDQNTRPRVSSRAAFETMSAAYSPENLAPETYLAHVVGQQRHPGAASTGDPEAHAFAATHFSQHGIPTSPHDVQVLNGGTRGLLLGLANTIAASPNRPQDLHRSRLEGD
jgi:hypothetical protein